jgi:hypothetical protein
MASNSANGNDPITGTLAATGDTSATPYTPQPGRAFNLHISGTWTGTAVLKRKLPGEAAYAGLTSAGAAFGSYTANMNEPISLIEPEAGALYMLDWTRSTGSLVYRFGQ